MSSIRIFEDRRVILENQAWEHQPSDVYVGEYATIVALSPGISITGNGANATPKGKIDFYSYYAPIVGHKYYIRPMYKVTNAVCSLVSFTFGGVTGNKSTPTNGTTYNDSVVLTATSTSLTFSISHTYASAATANGKVLELYQVIIADLTLAYGAGNEPTASVVDAYMTSNGLTYFGSDYSFNLNDFSTNGDKVLQPTKCLEVKQDNEDWYLDVKCSSNYKDFIFQDYLILAPTKQGDQPFRINNVENNGSEISFRARHVGYDLENYINWYSFGRRWIGSPSSQLNFVMDESVPVPPYTYSADTFTGGYVTYKESSVLGALNEIIATLGGHLVFDWWDVQIKETIGSDNQITIAYGKNLEGAKVVEDWSQVCTVLMPYGNNNLSINNVGDTLSATGVSYDRPYARKVNFQTDDETELIALGNAYLEQYKVPKINYTVKADMNANAIDTGKILASDGDFIVTADDVHIINSVFNGTQLSIGDVIYVKARQFTITTNVLGYTYDILTQRITRVEFGNFRKDARSVFSNIQGQLDETKKTVIQENIQMNAQIGAITGKTKRQETALTHNVATTGYTFDNNSEQGMWLVSSFIKGSTLDYVDAANYSSFMLVAVGGATGIKSLVGYNANTTYLITTLVGNDVTVTQKSGVAQTGVVVIQKIS